MTRIETFREAGLFDATAPRYTSYPPANHFGALDPDTHRRWVSELPPGPVSLYVHIPFCERLCWFCACRTQDVNSQSPVKAYLDVLGLELAALAAALPAHTTIGRSLALAAMLIGLLLYGYCLSSIAATLANADAPRSVPKPAGQSKAKPLASEL